MELARGVVVAGRYRLEHLLGQGGMGTVWAATHTVTRRKVALKLLRGLIADQPALRKRFLREARAASLVDHPNVVRIHDVFELEDGTPIMVMELLEGETLRVHLDRAGELGVEETASLLLPVVSAVGTAHELGVVHRDLKPENVLLTPDGRPKVLDFGIAKLHGDEGPTMTAAGTVLGTPCYMAPEQGFGEPDVDHRADVWALGVMLYEALSGGRPIEGENLGQVLKRLMDDGIAPLRAVAPDVPDDIALLVSRMLVRDKSERLEDLREVAEVLARHTPIKVPEFGAYGARIGDSVDDLQEVATPLARQHDTASPHTLPVEGQPTRRFALIGAAAVVAVATLIWLLSTGSDPAPVHAEAPGAASTPEAAMTPAALPSASAASASPPPLLSAEASLRPAPKPVVAPVTSSAAPMPLGVPPASTPSPPTPSPSKPTPPKGGLVEEPPF